MSGPAQSSPQHPPVTRPGAEHRHGPAVAAGETAATADRGTAERVDPPKQGESSRPRPEDLRRRTKPHPDEPTGPPPTFRHTYLERQRSLGVMEYIADHGSVAPAEAIDPKEGADAQTVAKQKPEEAPPPDYGRTVAVGPEETLQAVQTEPSLDLRR